MNEMNTINVKYVFSDTANCIDYFKEINTEQIIARISFDEKYVKWFTVDKNLTPDNPILNGITLCILEIENYELFTETIDNNIGIGMAKKGILFSWEWLRENSKYFNKYFGMFSYNNWHYWIEDCMKKFHVSRKEFDDYIYNPKFITKTTKPAKAPPLCEMSLYGEEPMEFNVTTVHHNLLNISWEEYTFDKNGTCQSIVGYKSDDLKKWYSDFKYKYELESKKWFDFYLNYNDDNIFHAENAFVSNGYHIMNPHTLIRLKNENLINHKKILKLEEN